MKFNEINENNLYIVQYDNKYECAIITRKCNSIIYSKSVINEKEVEGYKVPITFSDKNSLIKNLADLINKNYDPEILLFSSVDNKFNMKNSYDNEFSQFISELKIKENENYIINDAYSKSETYKNNLENFNYNIKQKGKNKKEISPDFYYHQALVLKLTDEIKLMKQLQKNHNKNYENSNKFEKNCLLVEHEQEMEK